MSLDHHQHPVPAVPVFDLVCSCRCVCLNNMTNVSCGMVFTYRHDSAKGLRKDPPEPPDGQFEKETICCIYLCERDSDELITTERIGVQGEESNDKFL
jgi:hypothetical protein